MHGVAPTMTRRIRVHCTWTLAGLLALAAPSAAVGGADGTVEARAHLVALRKPVISAEVAGRVLDVKFRPGQPFARGEILISFDCELHRAREARAQAQRDRAARQLTALQSLDRSGATSRLEVGVAQADMAAAEAELRLVRLAVQRCEIQAPFDGTVIEQRVQTGEYVSEGQPVIEVVDHASLELEAICRSSARRVTQARHASTSDSPPVPAAARQHSPPR
jgi:multidrug resistance efflux pump